MTWCAELSSLKYLMSLRSGISCRYIYLSYATDGGTQEFGNDHGDKMKSETSCWAFWLILQEHYCVAYGVKDKNVSATCLKLFIFVTILSVGCGVNNIIEVPNRYCCWELFSLGNGEISFLWSGDSGDEAVMVSSLWLGAWIVQGFFLNFGFNLREHSGSSQRSIVL